MKLLKTSINYSISYTQCNYIYIISFKLMLCVCEMTYRVYLFSFYCLLIQLMIVVVVVILVFIIFFIVLCHVPIFLG